MYRLLSFNYIINRDMEEKDYFATPDSQFSKIVGSWNQTPDSRLPERI